MAQFARSLLSQHPATPSAALSAQALPMKESAQSLVNVLVHAICVPIAQVSGFVESLLT